MNRTGLSPKLALFIWAVPLALVVGYCLAAPDRVQSMMIVGTVMVILIMPLLLHFHYPILLFSWNLVFAFGFIRGQPSLWMLMAGIGLGIAILSRIMNKEFRLQHVRSVSVALLFLLSVVLVTAWLTGGIGLRSMGSNVYGGKKFAFILAAVLGYFAISMLRIPGPKVRRYTGLFFLSGVSAVVPNLIYMAGPAAWILFVLFPTDMAVTQAFDDVSLHYTEAKFARMTGVTFACQAVFMYLTARFGLAGILNLRKPLRLLLFLLTLGLSLIGGYRSAVVLFGSVCVFQFFFEGLHKTRLLPFVLGGLLIGAAVLVPTVSKLPLSVQRSLSMLPLDVDPIARASAQASIDWRLEVWRTAALQIKDHLWVGKGYAIDPSDLYLAAEGARRGFNIYDEVLVTGDYHSGPLSVIIPFGIFGVIGFLWFIFASIRVLFLNYKFCDASLRTLNTFLLSYFVARFLFFVFGMGALSSDMPVFAGLIAFSVAVNGGINKKTAEQLSVESSDSLQHVGGPTPVPVPA